MVTLIVSSGFAAKLLVSKGIGTIKHTTIKTDVRNETTDLQDFSVIHISAASNLRIFPGETNQLEYDEISGENIKPPKTAAIQDYIVKNDTLFINNLRNASNGGYTLRVSSLKHLIVKNTTSLDLKRFSQDSLLINSVNSNVTISENSTISYVELKSGQKFDLVFKSRKDFGMALSEDNCTISGDIAEVSGMIGNYTALGIPRRTEKVAIDTSDNGKLHYIVN
ncbi:hypothetical protein [Algoriphagus sp.]|uniref:hypothetical protein n=1 Tax=Algoriphagus sp. TaxID=1872435 RepID=UPI003291ACB2